MDAESSATSISPPVALTPVAAARVGDADGVFLKKKKKPSTSEPVSADGGASSSEASSPASGYMSTAQGHIQHRSWSFDELSTMSKAFENQVGFPPKMYCFFLKTIIFFIRRLSSQNALFLL